MGPGHNQKIAFWFQHLLDGNGAIIERGKGFFSILFRYGEDMVPRCACFQHSKHVAHGERQPRPAAIAIPPRGCIPEVRICMVF